MAVSPPTGTITLMFTDIENSTALWEQFGDGFREMLDRHNEIIRTSIDRWEGYEVKTEGDSFMVAFARATDAVECAIDVQRSFASFEPPIYIRIGLHTGEPFLGYDAAGRVDYLGTPVNRAARISAAGHGGQILISSATRDVVIGSVTTEIEFADMGRHRLRGLEQLEQLYEVQSSELAARDYPPLRTLDAVRTNLPSQITSFIGREKELQELTALLARAETRLLTLVGPGGCGKTRLSLRAATEVLDQFEHGAWLVELAPLNDAALVPQTIASALGVREEGSRPIIETITDFLKPKRLLLLLDNCEHLLDATSQAAAHLLRDCSQLNVLATSREGLGIVGEQIYRVPSLSVPDTRRLPPVEHLSQYEAVRLFADRAVLVQPAFTINNQNAPAVAQICHRLDGIPLALELAAARVRALSVDQINTRINDLFRLLTGGSRTALPRQRTLRALIDWSHDLLSDKEKALLRRLSVFAGGWSLEAAEKVCSDDAETRIEEWETLDLLTALVEKSLVVYEEDEQGVGRYGLLQTVQRYALEELQKNEDADVLRQRHADYFLAFAQTASQELTGTHQATWMERLEVEHDNLRTSLTWYQFDENRAKELAQFAGSLSWFWHVRGYASEGRKWLEEALRQREMLSPELQAQRSIKQLFLITPKTTTPPRVDSMKRAWHSFEAWTTSGVLRGRWEIWGPLPWSRKTLQQRNSIRRRV